MNKARKAPRRRRGVESAPEAKPGPVPRYSKGMKAIAVSICALAACLVSGCGNMDMCDTNYTYHRAIVKWPDGSVKEIEVKQWLDYEGEQVQLLGGDGKIYLVSMNNAVLIRD